MEKNDGGTQMMVVLTVKEIRCVVVGPFDDLVSSVLYLQL